MDFLVLFEFIFLSVFLTLLLYFINIVLQGKGQDNKPQTIEDSELEASNEVKTQYTPRFFTFALCFLLFEAQCALLFPFAYITRVLDIFCIIEIMIFILILIFSLLFGIKSGLFELD